MPPPKKNKKLAVASPNLPAPIPDIPPDRVGQVVQSFITDSEVKQMDVNQQPDGDFTVTPTRRLNG